MSAVTIAFDGPTVTFIHNDTVSTELRKALQPSSVKTVRASNVEPDPDSPPTNPLWHADLSPVGGPNLTGFTSRGDAISAEIDYLKQHILPKRASALLS